MTPPYFITFRTYGTWIHGDREGSVDNEHNRLGQAFVPVDSRRATRSRDLMRGPPVTLNSNQRAIVLCAIGEVCRHRGWLVWAIHVRATHVHAVVSVHARPVPPERAMNDFKVWTTRHLRDRGFITRDVHPWVVHGSTRWLNSRNSFARACHYVYHEQDGAKDAMQEWLAQAADAGAIE